MGIRRLRREGDKKLKRGLLIAPLGGDPFKRFSPSSPVSPDPLPVFGGA
jgi:hypothetical protein